MISKLLSIFLACGLNNEAQKFQFSQTFRRYSIIPLTLPRTNNKDPAEELGARASAERKCSRNTCDSNIIRRQRKISIVHEDEEASSLSESEEKITALTSPQTRSVSGENGSENIRKPNIQVHCFNKVRTCMSDDFELCPEDCSLFSENSEEFSESLKHVVPAKSIKSLIGN